ncbi:hypothetical protein F0P96_19050 [Hymenobacter busanensis]|uniref:Uncharacterized protein n=1 Tax=Hymenobacter busanensis TaxID=2607656 RepID=A0A7L4ZU11_9BACT|nr:hypothetical protein [Hymenobacter busanensis]KAA9325864.1 hypothetical protein F0P96_19050 [Hymenobacter busanensis]QHJ06296.1 hypothetical protein GUY19_02875 [Hymenobacter busanensis]
MKNALLALALFAFVGSASATDGKDEKGKKAAKKEACSAEAKAHCGGAKASTASLGGVPACCAKKGASASAEKSTDTKAASAVKSL